MRGLTLRVVSMIAAAAWSGAAPAQSALGSAVPTAGGVLAASLRAEDGQATSRTALPGWSTAAMPLDTGSRGAMFGPNAAPLGTQRMPRGTPRRLGADSETQRCTADGVHCISLTSYIPDVCRTIEATAQEAGLDPHFFARLLWRESLFDANAVSHAGAQGIAQFMPGTAKMYDLADPFNPAEALRASARLLMDLYRQFGNLGLAAAGYNAGPGRVDRFLSGASRLPGETRAYVAAITGHRGEDWRDGKPKPDLRLDANTPFVTACQQKAEGRAIDGFRVPTSEPDSTPWASVLASHRSAGIARHRYARLVKRHAAAMKDLDPQYVERSLPGRPGRQVAAQIGADSHEEAQALCRRLTRSGVPCVAVKS